MPASNRLRNASAALAEVVEFAQLDLLALPPKPYLDALRKIHAFIQRDDPSKRDPQIDVDLNRAPTLFQERALEILRGAASPHGTTLAGDLVLTFVGIRKGSKIRFVVHGSPLDRFQYQIVRVLEQAGAHRLLSCAAPDCDRLFLRVTKKKYCSARCQSRIYMRDFREGKTGGN